MVRDPDFSRVMEQMGVTPIGTKAPSVGHQSEQDNEPQEPRSTGRESAGEDQALFLKAMAQIDAVPDKDIGDDSASSEALRKLKLKDKSKLIPEDTLDLHGKTVDEALGLLAGFVSRAFVAGSKSVIIITGKGKHSRGGVGILRPRVEAWIKEKGRRFVRTYAEAPRAFGGKGAFILQLKDR